MKLKSSAIAVAVAGALGASMAAQAESGFYADLRIGFQAIDTKGNTEIQIQNQSSRFGWRGETDMGNGLTGFGRMEFGLNTEGDNGTQAVTNTDSDGDPAAPFDADTNDPEQTGETASTGSDPIFRRHAYVGLKGDWGKVTIGQTYHTFYNFITGPLDNPLLGTAPGSASQTWLGYTGRTAQAISYSGDWGIFALGVTGNFDNSSTSAGAGGVGQAPTGSSNDLDKYELAGSFQAGPVNLAIGISDQNEIRGIDPEPIIGLLASGWQTGIFTWGLGYTMQDGTTDAGFETGDASSIVFDVIIGNGYFHWEQKETKGLAGASDTTPTNLTLGYTQSLGRQTSVYYEYQTIDADTASSNDDIDNITVALRYKWK